MKTLMLLCGLIFTLTAFAEELRSKQIPYPFYAEHNEGQNQIMSIEFGRAALLLRLDMIRRAQKSIEVEYFIYNTDMAAKIFTRELVAAANRGVKVRILVDYSLPIFELKPSVAKALENYGIEVKYYNTASLAQLSTVQFRNHRKLLVVDDVEAMTGGRNIGDDYFDLSHEFNFHDRDVYVKGPMAKVMRESFDKYFEHKISKNPKYNENNVRALEKAQEFLTESEEEVAVRARIEKEGREILDRKALYTCPQMTFSSDGPGANFKARLSPTFSKNYRFLRKTLYDKTKAIDKNLLISSPYMINNFHTRKMMKRLLKKGVDITIYTNSLASTDAIYVAANLYIDVFRWNKRGINIFLHDGLSIEETPAHPEEIMKARWGTHDKTQIYETSTYSEVMIGTYNIDNRSNFYNSEMAIFCKGNDEFTAEVKNHILSRKFQGIQINDDGSVTNRAGESRSVLGSDRKGVWMMRLIALPSWLLKFLL